MLKHVWGSLTLAVTIRIQQVLNENICIVLYFTMWAEGKLSNVSPLESLMTCWCGLFAQSNMLILFIIFTWIPFSRTWNRDCCFWVRRHHFKRRQMELEKNDCWILSALAVNITFSGSLERSALFVFCAWLEAFVNLQLIGIWYDDLTRIVKPSRFQNHWRWTWLWLVAQKDWFTLPCVIFHEDKWSI